MSEAKFPRLKLPPEVVEQRNWQGNRGGKPSDVGHHALTPVEVRPEAELMDNMPEPVNRAERRYRDKMVRRTSGESS